MSIIFITHWCVLVAMQSRTFQLLMLASSARRQGLQGMLGGDTSRTADPNSQRDIPYHMMSCSVCKLGQLAEGQRMPLGGWVSVVGW